MRGVESSYPNGYPMSFLEENLHPCGADGNGLSIAEIKDRLRPYRKRLESHLYLRDWRGFARFWREKSNLLTPGYFSQFTYNEKVSLLNGPFRSKLMEEFEDKPEYQVIEMIFSSVWKWSMSRCNHNKLVAHYNAIKSFDFGLPGFSVTIDHAYGTNINGPGANKESVYLDGMCAFYIHYKDEHVMTIGFSPVEDGVLLHQVQLEKKMGNRWIYILPMDRLEYVISRLEAAFVPLGLPIWLVDGRDLAKTIMYSYSNVLERPSKKELERIRIFYDRRLLRYVRTRPGFRINHNRFYRLRPRDK